MAPRKKESAEPTRRSTRTVSQSSTAPETTSTSAAKKREHAADDSAMITHVPAPDAKKAKTSLGVGDKLPDITLLDEEGNTVQIVDITYEKGVMLFAYPRASTPGCTKQVCCPSFVHPIFYFIFVFQIRN